MPNLHKSSIINYMQDWIESKNRYLTPPVLPAREHLALLLTNLEDIRLPDLVAIDKDEHAILVAKIKGYPYDFQKADTREFALLDLIDVLKFATKNLIPFAMLVDKNNIELFRWDGQSLSDVILTLNTANVVELYFPDYRLRQEAYNSSLPRMIETWLLGLTSNWKPETPPYKKEMQEIGFLDLMKDGTTRVYS